MANSRKKIISYEGKRKTRIGLRVNCVVFLKQTTNNLFITVKNRTHRVLLVRSSGNLGYKGSKRSTSFAAVALAKDIFRPLRLAFKRSIYARVVLLSKITKNTKLAIKNLSYAGIRLLELIERIPVPHNGVRGSKIRRI